MYECDGCDSDNRNARGRGMDDTGYTGCNENEKVIERGRKGNVLEEKRHMHTS